MTYIQVSQRSILIPLIIECNDIWGTPTQVGEFSQLVSTLKYYCNGIILPDDYWAFNLSSQKELQIMGIEKSGAI
jgi:hypothetical protein